jgi:gliding motility-associated-like protein
MQFFFVIWLNNPVLRKKLLLAAVHLLLVLGIGQAKHIIGGEFYYQVVSVDTAKKITKYLFTMKVYRDPNSLGADFDDPAIIGIFTKNSNNVYSYLNRLEVSLKSHRNLDAVIDSCYVVPPNIEVEEGIYQFEMNLPIISNSYVLSYQRCCRNETITNIIKPGDTGAAYEIEITPEAQRLYNNSPQFVNFPPIVICSNQPIDFDHFASDIEGDSMVYEFCAPLTAGGTKGSSTLDGGRATDCDGVTPDPAGCPPPFKTVSFRNPIYTYNQPMGGNPVVAIDSKTGKITGTPTVQGQFVVGVCAKEYRNGQLLSVIRRDFQFNVTYCQSAVSALITSDSVNISNQEFVINSCGTNTVKFFNQSTLEKNIKSYLWEFDIKGNKEIQTGKDAEFDFPGQGQYSGLMIINKGTRCSDTAKLSVRIYPAIDADFDYSYDTCYANPVIFKDKSFTGSKQMESWNWSLESGVNASTKDVNHIFRKPGTKSVTLQVKDINGCVDSRTKTFDYYPVPALIVVDPTTTEGCQPVTVFFDNLSYPIDSTYDILWDFGDGSTSTEISPKHTFNSIGTFNVKLNIRSPIGCETQKDFPSWIQVKQSPIAGFSYTPDELNSLHKTIQVVDESKFASQIDYFINGKQIFDGSNPRYTFRDTGIYLLRQIVTHSNACADTLDQYLDIEPFISYFLPNAFTPNGDGNNDDYFGKGYFDGMSSFMLSIWDRWGSQLFKTEDPYIVWRGTFGESDKQVPDGVYVYRYQYRTPRGLWVEKQGTVTLLR